jgi:ABC-type lipoprotein release transport system permease subunit
MLALGATPRSIWSTVVSEAFAVALVSLVLGSILIFPLMVWFHNAPPDMSWLLDSDVTLMGALLSPSLRVEYNPSFWLTCAVALIVTAVIAALYPAFRAGRTPPADTLSGL